MNNYCIEVWNRAEQTYELTCCYTDEVRLWEFLDEVYPDRPVVIEKAVIEPDWNINVWVN